MSERKPKPPILDRLLGAVAPEAALRRAVARVQLGAVRAYESAQNNRRTEGWTTARTSGPITEVRQGRAALRDRSRDLVRNNAWIHRAVKIKVASQIGTGIRPRANTGNPALNKQIDDVFEQWQSNCAPDSGGSFYGMQGMVGGSRCESGECLILLDKTGRANNPLRLQVLEPDWLVDDIDVAAREVPGGKRIRDGIVFDDQNLRVGYRLYANNPSETLLGLKRGVLEVPSSDMLHIFRADRPGQIRGVPDAASVMMRCRDLDDYHDAALIMARVQATLGVFIKQAGGAAASPLGMAGTDPNGKRLEHLTTGMIAYLQPGEEPEFLAPEGSGPFEQYTRIALHMIAAGFGLTYHQLTGDLSQANYSSLRAGSLEFRRQIEQEQHLILIPQMCQPIWDAFITSHILAGRLPPAAAGAPAKWTPPRFELIDPNRDTTAIIAQVRAGLMTLPEAISEMGYDPQTQLDEIAASNAQLTAKGIMLDSDPRFITGAGGAVDAKQLAAAVLSAQETAP